MPGAQSHHCKEWWVEESSEQGSEELIVGFQTGPRLSGPPLLLELISSGTSMVLPSRFPWEVL